MPSHYRCLLFGAGDGGGRFFVPTIQRQVGTWTFATMWNIDVWLSDIMTREANTSNSGASNSLRLLAPPTGNVWNVIPGSAFECGWKHLFVCWRDITEWVGLNFWLCFLKARGDQESLLWASRNNWLWPTSVTVWSRWVYESVSLGLKYQCGWYWWVVAVQSGLIKPTISSCVTKQRKRRSLRAKAVRFASIGSSQLME